MKNISSMKRKKNISTIILFSLLSLLILNLPLYSAQTGKIAGKIIDAKTGDPIAAANILLEGTRLGACCDLDGEYYILNVPPGVYTMTASTVGYAKQIVNGVVVSSGQTTWYNLKLAPSVVDMEEVVVTYEQPPVNIQETSMRSTVRKETIEELPVSTIEQVLEIQAGAVTGANGELHLRGGRSGEIVYYIDGQRVEDPIDGSSPLFINRESVEELTVLSGTFNAEYGDAMSGVVQIITKDGSEDFHANFEYQSPLIFDSPYREADWVESGSDAVRDSTESAYQEAGLDEQPENIIPVEGRVHFSLSGPVTRLDNTTFYFSSTIHNEDNYLPFGYDQNRSLNGKVTKSYGMGGKLSFSGGYAWSNYQNYSHAWKYMPEHYLKHFLRDSRFDMQWVHSVSDAMFFSLHTGYHRQNHDTKIFEEWEDYLDSGYQPQDFTFANYFFDEADWSNVWRESASTTYTVGGEGTYQYGNYHQFKGGFETQSLELEMLDIREMDIGADDLPGGIIDNYEENPMELSAYIQDKIELSYLVVNAGLRWDYVDPRSEGWSNPEDPESQIKDAPVSQQVSPRLGLAHPINDDMSLYFAFGHFFQYPHYQSLFMNSVDMNPDTLSNRSFDAVGNRSLKPQKTVAYEFGLKGNLSKDLGFTVTAYYKDITDLTGSKLVRVGTKYNYSMFRNIDYASVKGFEIGVTRRLNDGWSFEGNYAYSVAKGNSSEPLEGFWNVYYNQPEARQEYYLDFDRRHVLNGMLVYQTRAGHFKYDWMNEVFGNLTLGIIGSYASGLPYTPYTGAGEQLALTNSARMDGSATIDVRLSKVLMNAPAKVTLLINIDNLFDFTNDLRVNSQTGEPWEAPLVGNDIAFDQLHDPSKVDIPRMVRIGLKAEL